VRISTATDVGAVDLAAVATSYGQPSGDGEVFGVRHMLQVMQQNGASCVAP
jgi:hypothetical protein